MVTNIPKEVVEEIRKENDIVDVIEEYVQLNKQGRNYFGLCPFHNEKTPSFSVTKERQIFHCFGCGKGGNVIQFLMEIENITFPEAVQFLAKRINYTLPNSTKQRTFSKESSTLLSAYEWLTKYYHHLLKYTDEGKVGLDYLKNRGINTETIERFQLGYAPSKSEFTIEFLKQKGFHETFLVKAGLLSSKDQQHYTDSFRGRVIFPIYNHLGKVVAFGGRAIKGEKPKYLNSPEHDLFKKGNLLYNFSTAKGHIRKQREVIIFEGYLDVLAADQAGFKHIVATLGTALTNAQASLLKRYVDTAVLCYDGDEAGLQASYQAAVIFREIGCDVKIARLKEGLDPDDYIQKYGGEQFKHQIIDQSDTFFKFFMHYKKADYNMNIDSERITYVEMIVQQLATIDSPIEREYYVREIADEFNLSEDIILHELNEHRKRNNQFKKDKSDQISNTNKRMSFTANQILPAYWKAEKLLLANMFKHPHVIERVQADLGVQFNIEEHKVILTHLYALYEEKNSIDVSKLVDKVKDEHLVKMITEIAVTPINEQVQEEEISDYISIIQREATDLSYIRSLKQKQKQEKDPFLAAKIGLEIIALEKQLKSSK